MCPLHTQDPSDRSKRGTMPGKLGDRAEGFLLGTLTVTLAYAAYSWLQSRRRKSFSTEDRSLFYGPPEELTKILPDARFLPKEVYGQAVRLLPILCIDICLQRSSDGKILLVKRGTEPVKGYWWVPGGRILRGETFYAAALRKAKEECGVEATPKKVLGTWNTFFPTSAWGGGTHTINVGVHLITDEKDVVLDATSSEYRWVSASEIYREHDAYVQELAQEIGL